MSGSEVVLKIRAWISLVVLTLLFPLIIAVSVIRHISRPLWEKCKNVAGEVALITGGAGGLGKEIAMKLAAKGCHIAIVDINEEAAQATAKLIAERYNVKVKAFKADISKFEEVTALAKSVEEQLGPVTILVNNAGMMLLSKSPDSPPEEIQQMINTNITAHIWTVRVFMEKMKELGKGHIVAVSSAGGIIPVHRQLVYTTSKFAIRGFMLALQTEIYAQNCEFIKTTTVFPYFMKTHPKVTQIFKNTGITVYPIVPGVQAANEIVEGVIRNHKEVFIPNVLIQSLKFLEFLPREWYMHLVNNVVGRENMAALKW